MEVEGLFGFAVFIIYNSVSITHNSKMVRPTVVFGLFSVFVSIIQFFNF